MEYEIVFHDRLKILHPLLRMYLTMMKGWRSFTASVSIKIMFVHGRVIEVINGIANIDARSIFLQSENEQG